MFAAYNCYRNINCFIHVIVFFVQTCRGLKIKLGRRAVGHLPLPQVFHNLCNSVQLHMLIYVNCRTCRIEILEILCYVQQHS